MSNAAAARGTLGTIRNAAALLDLLSQGPSHHQLTDLAERSGLSVPTVHRLLRSLMAAGLVSQDPRSSRYGLGSELVRLSERYLERLPLLQVIGPYLVELRNATSATVLVALLVRHTVVYVDRIDGADVGGIFRRTDRSAPAERTAAGRLLLARAGPESWKQLVSDGNGLPSPDQWREWSTAGYLVSEVAHLDGHREVAVPIPNGAGEVVAALVATGGPPSFTQTQMEAEIAPQLARTATLIARVADRG